MRLILFWIKQIFPLIRKSKKTIGVIVVIDVVLIIPAVCVPRLFSKSVSSLIEGDYAGSFQRVGIVMVIYFASLLIKRLQFRVENRFRKSISIDAKMRYVQLYFKPEYNQKSIDFGRCFEILQTDTVEVSAFVLFSIGILFDTVYSAVLFYSLLNVNLIVAVIYATLLLAVSMFNRLFKSKSRRIEEKYRKRVDKHIRDVKQLFMQRKQILSCGSRQTA